MVQPSMSFFDIVKKKGFPTRRARFCCDKLKEYKVLNFAIQGIRKSESKVREERYKEPIICRIYGAKKNNVQVVLPILDWTDEDVRRYLACQSVEIDERLRLSHSSLDCWFCTAYWDQLKERLAYMDRHHPDKAEYVREHVVRIRSAIENNMNRIGEV